MRTDAVLQVVITAVFMKAHRQHIFRKCCWWVPWGRLPSNGMQGAGSVLTSVDLEPDHEVGDDGVEAGLQQQVGQLHDHLSGSPGQLSVVARSPLPAHHALNGLSMGLDITQGSPTCTLPA